VLIHQEIHCNTVIISSLFNIDKYQRCNDSLYYIHILYLCLSLESTHKYNRIHDVIHNSYIEYKIITLMLSFYFLETQLIYIFKIERNMYMLNLAKAKKRVLSVVNNNAHRNKKQ